MRWQNCIIPTINTESNVLKKVKVKNVAPHEFVNELHKHIKAAFDVAPKHSKADRSLLEEAYVYVLWRGDEIVYVGCTGNLKRRLRDHAKDESKSWDTFQFIKAPHHIGDYIETFGINYLNPTANKNYPHLDAALRNVISRMNSIDRDLVDLFGRIEDLFASMNDPALISGESGESLAELVATLGECAIKAYVDEYVRHRERMRMQVLYHLSGRIRHLIASANYSTVSVKITVDGRELVDCSHERIPTHEEHLKTSLGVPVGELVSTGG